MPVTQLPDIEHARNYVSTETCCVCSPLSDPDKGDMTR